MADDRGRTPPSESDAATRIQAGFRGQQARSERRKQDQSARLIQGEFRRSRSRSAERSRSPAPRSSDREVSGEEERGRRRTRPSEEDAATRIQAGFRGQQVRSEKKKQDQSARLIQGEFRRSRSRSADRSERSQSPGGPRPPVKPRVGSPEAPSESTANSSEDEGSEKEFMDPPSPAPVSAMSEDAAASRIQASFRGSKERAELQKQQDAAKKIQGGFRDSRSRASSRSSIRSTSPGTPGTPRSVRFEDEAAATRIQASFRGHQARLNSPSRDIVSSAPSSDQDDALHAAIKSLEDKNRVLRRDLEASQRSAGSAEELRKEISRLEYDLKVAKMSSPGAGSQTVDLTLLKNELATKNERIGVLEAEVANIERSMKEAVGMQLEEASGAHKTELEAARAQASESRAKEEEALRRASEAEVLCEKYQGELQEAIARHKAESEMMAKQLSGAQEPASAARMNSIQNENRSLLQKVRTLETEVSLKANMEVKLKAAEAEVHSLKEMVDDVGKFAKETEEKEDGYKAEIAVLTKKCDALQAAVEQHERTHTRLVEAEALNESLQTKLDRLESTASNLLNTRDEDIQSTEGKLAAAKEKLAQEEAKHSEQVKELQSQIDGLSSTKSDMEASIEDFRERLNTAQEEAAAARSAQQSAENLATELELKVAAADKSRALAEANLEEVREQAKGLDTELRKAKMDALRSPVKSPAVERIEKDNDDLRAELTKANEDLKDTSNKLQVVEAQLASNLAMLSNANTLVTELESNLELEKSRNDALQSELAKTNEAVEELGSRLNEKHASVGELDREKSIHLDALENAKDDLAKAKEEVSTKTSENAALAQRIVALEGEKQEVSKSVKAKDFEIEGLKKRVEVLEGDAEDLLKKANAHQEVASLRSATDKKHRDEIDGYKEKLKDMQSQMNELEAKYNAAERRAAARSGSISIPVGDSAGVDAAADLEAINAMLAKEKALGDLHLGSRDNPESMERAVTSLEKQIDMYKSKVSTLELLLGRIPELESKAKTAEEELQREIEKHQATQLDLQDLQAKTTGAAEGDKKKKSIFGGGGPSRAEVKAQKEADKAAQNRIQNLEKTLKSKEIDNLTAQIATLQANTVDMIAKHEAVVADLNSQIKAREEDLRALDAVSTMNYNDLQADLAKARTEIGRLEMKVKKVEVEAETEKALIQEEKDSAVAQAAAVKQQLESELEQAAELSRVLTERDEELNLVKIETLQERVANKDLSLKVSQVESEVKMLMKDVADRDQANATLYETVQQKEEQLMQLSSAERSNFDMYTEEKLQLQKKIAQLEESASEAEKESKSAIDEKERAILDLEAKLEDTQSKLDTLEQMDGVNYQAWKVDTEKLEKKCATKEKELAEATAKHEEQIADMETKTRELNDYVGVLEKAKASLEAELETELNAYKELEKTSSETEAELNSEVTGLRAEVAVLMGRLDDSHADLIAAEEKATKEITRLTEEVARLEATVQKNMKELKEMADIEQINSAHQKSENDALKAANDQFKKDNEKIRADMNIQVKTRNVEIRELKEKISDLEGQVARLELDVEGWKKSDEENFKNHQEQTTELCDQLDKAAADKKVMLEKHAKEDESIRQKLAEVEALNLKQKIKISDLEAQISKRMEDIKSLDAMCNDHRGQNTLLSKELSDRKLRVVFLEGELTSMKNKYSLLEKQAKAGIDMHPVKTENSTLRSRISEMAKQIKSQMREINEQGEYITRLTKELEQQKSISQNFELQIATEGREVMKRVDKMKDQTRTLSSQLVEKTRMLEEATPVLAEKEELDLAHAALKIKCEAMEKQIAELQEGASQLIIVTAERDHLQDQVSILTTESENRRLKIESMEDEHKATDDRNLELEMIHKDGRRRVQEMEAEMAVLGPRVRQLESDLFERNEDNGRLKLQHDDMKIEISEQIRRRKELEVRLEMKEKEFQNMQVDMKKLENHNSETYDKLIKSDAECSKIPALEQDVKNLTLRVRQLDELVNVRDVELHEARRSVEDRSRRVDELTDNIEVLQVSVTELQEERTRLLQQRNDMARQANNMDPHDRLPRSSSRGSTEFEELTRSNSPDTEEYGQQYSMHIPHQANQRGPNQYTPRSRSPYEQPRSTSPYHVQQQQQGRHTPQGMSNYDMQMQMEREARQQQSKSLVFGAQRVKSPYPQQQGGEFEDAPAPVGISSLRPHGATVSPSPRHWEQGGYPQGQQHTQEFFYDDAPPQQYQQYQSTPNPTPPPQRAYPPPNPLTYLNQRDRSPSPSRALMLDTPRLGKTPQGKPDHLKSPYGQSNRGRVMYDANGKKFVAAPVRATTPGTGGRPMETSFL